MEPANKVHVVDDDAAVRDSLQLLLEASGLPVQTYGSANEFLGAAAGLAGCVLTDVRMPDIDGLELQRRLNERGIRLPVIVMTAQADVPLAVRAMKAGAVDFLEKPFSDDALLNAVTRALGEGQKLRQEEATASKAAHQLAALTPREREVLDLLVIGLSNKAIANKLDASPRTVEVHRARVFEKLHARSIADLIHLVQAAGASGGRASRPAPTLPKGSGG
jgi:two-component system response regulator FixJ